jgi:hypothetical protein
MPDSAGRHHRDPAGSAEKDGRPSARRLLVERLGLDAEAEWLDLRTCDSTELSEVLAGLARGCRFEKVIFGAPDYGAPPVDLTNVTFPRDSVFEDVSFARMALDSVTFPGKCDFDGCDFRYVRASGANFKDACFRSCDFYSAVFSPASVFLGGVRLDGVSFGNASLAAITGLTKETFQRSQPALIQERRRDEYEAFLSRTKQDRDAGHPVEKALEEAPRDAASAYRALAGMWTSQGQLSDARFAYVRSQDLERQFASPWNTYRVNRARKRRDAERLKYGPRQFFSWLWLSLAWAFSYGDSFMRVGASLVGINLLPALAYSLAGGVRYTGGHTVHNFFSCWLFSFEQLTASPAHRLESTGSIVDLVGSLQTVASITLLGLFGFALANRLRGS